jgi:hypothetical protein
MRVGVFLSALTMFVSLLGSAAFGADGPPWALISTEVDEEASPPGFMDRQVLQLDSPNYAWPGSLYFDPGTEIFGEETGLDAIHLLGGLICFSTEVDIVYQGVTYLDEQLLCWNGSTLSTAPSIDLFNGYLGDDYGLDAACYVDAAWIISTEVGGSFDSGASFTDGDAIIVYSDGGSRVISMEPFFGMNVGLDALHAYHEFPTDNDPEQLELIMSTEVDGSIFDPDSQTLLDFNDEDILSLHIHYDASLGSWALDSAEVSWIGVDKMGSDVGLDALYLGVIPEPATVLVAGLGLSVLVARLRRKK